MDSININSFLYFGLWSDHISCKKNYADALLVIASLEIHLKAIEEKELK
jgi:hypothetical protein